MFVISNLKVYILIKKKKKGYLVLCVAATMLFHQIICSISYLIHIILFTLQIILEPQSLLLRGKVKVKSLSCVQLFATPWTVANQVLLSMRILQARILKWVSISFPRGSFQPRDRIWVSWIAGRLFTLWPTQVSSSYSFTLWATQVAQDTHFLHPKFRPAFFYLLRNLLIGIWRCFVCLISLCK